VLRIREGLAHTLCKLIDPSLRVFAQTPVLRFVALVNLLSYYNATLYYTQG